MRPSYDRVLVTGGAGFIGSHTTDALIDAAVETWIIDDLSTGRHKNLFRCRPSEKLHLVRTSILNFKAVQKVARRVDAIVHLAAKVSPYVSMRKPEITNEINVNGTLNILRAGLAAGVQKVVFASSSSVYGNTKRSRIGENEPTNPITPYGASKLAAEKYCQAFYQAFGLPTVSLRYFNVYGERQSSNPYSGVIAIFANTLLGGRRPTIYGDGNQTRDFIHVSDVARANLLALGNKMSTGQALNVGTGRATSVRDLYGLLAQVSKKEAIRPIFQKSREGDIKNSCADLTRTIALLHFKPKVALRSGLELLLTSLASEGN